MASIEIAGVEKAYGATKVIHGITIDIAEGEFVTLVGPSGCGKSTLLRMIGGLEPISGGTISIGNRVVNDLPPKDRDIAMVFQNYALYPHMTVAENMGFSLRLRKASRSEFDAAIQRAAGILGLENLLHRYPKELSGGQRQRVAMGRAIVRNPQVFLFDEPLSNLDAKLRVQMRAEIKALHQRLGTTIVYVTHDQIEAMTMADKIVVMHGGIVEQVGSPLELYDRPANQFVAGFLGSPSMNFLSGEIVETNGLRFQLAPEIAIALPSGAAIRPGPVVLGIRPEDIVLSPDGFPAIIKVVEPTGSETHLAVSVAGQAMTIVLRDRFSGQTGDTMNIAIRPGKFHLFDAGTGIRL